MNSAMKSITTPTYRKTTSTRIAIRILVCLETVIRVSIFSLSSKHLVLESALTANGTRNER